MLYRARFWLAVAVLCAGSWCVISLPSASHAADEGEFGYVLMTDNRVVKGNISSQFDSFLIAQPSGKLVVPFEQVRHRGKSMADLYQYLQGQLPRKPTAHDHIELARWCLGFRLMSEARLELGSALELEPNREDIRTWIERLDQLLKAPPTAAPEQVASRSPGSLDHPENAESLLGLSRSAGQEFTRRIHPILMNNCTNSACHGPRAEHELRFEIVRTVQPRQRPILEQNLQALLKYVDRAHPKRSPLWQLLRKNHGAQGRSLFAGPRGQEQAEIMQNWLLSLGDADEDHSAATQTVAWPKEATPSRSPHKTRLPDAKNAPPVPRATQARVETNPRVNQHALQLLSGQTEEPADAPAEQTPEPGPIVPASATEVETEIVPPAPLPWTDPFDPAAFNRRQRIKRTVQ